MNSTQCTWAYLFSSLLLKQIQMVRNQGQDLMTLTTIISFGVKMQMEDSTTRQPEKFGLMTCLEADLRIPMLITSSGVSTAVMRKRRTLQGSTLKPNQTSWVIVA